MYGSILFNDLINPASRLLLNGATLIAIHEARYFKGDDGKLALGPGPFVKGLEYAADCKAQVLGKPCPEFFRTGLEGVDPSEAIMIGDVRFIDKLSSVFISQCYILF